MPASTETFFTTSQSRAGRRGWVGLTLVVLLIGLIALAEKADAAPTTGDAAKPAAEHLTRGR
jgi:hypothetical protein